MFNRATPIDASPADLAAFIRETTHEADHIHVYGEVDTTNADSLERAIGMPHMVGRELIVHLSSCRYMDSSGLAVLVRAKQRFARDFRVVTGANPSMDRLLELSALDGILT